MKANVWAMAQRWPLVRLVACAVWLTALASMVSWATGYALEL
jgi:hypothetical protein